MNRRDISNFCFFPYLIRRNRHLFSLIGLILTTAYCDVFDEKLTHPTESIKFLLFTNNSSALKIIGESSSNQFLLTLLIFSRRLKTLRFVELSNINLRVFDCTWIVSKSISGAILYKYPLIFRI